MKGADHPSCKVEEHPWEHLTRESWETSSFFPYDLSPPCASVRISVKGVFSRFDGKAGRFARGCKSITLMKSRLQMQR